MVTKRKKPPKQVVMWQGIGILSPHEVFLEAYTSKNRSPYILHKFAASPRGSRLVLVTARLEALTKKQVAETDNVAMGIVEPPAKL